MAIIKEGRRVVLEKDEYRIENDGIWISKKALEDLGYNNVVDNEI